MLSPQSRQPSQAVCDQQEKVQSPTQKMQCMLPEVYTNVMLRDKEQLSRIEST